MRPLLHFVAMLLALPQVLLCALFLAIGHLAASTGLVDLFVRILDGLAILFSWGGLLAIVTFLALLGTGMSPRARPFAAATVALIVLASGVLLALEGGMDPLLFLPGATSFAISVWLAWPVKRASVLGATAEA